MTPRPVPQAVRRRNRLTLATDAAIGVVVLSAAIHFMEPGISNLLWGLGCLAATSGTIALRSSIGARDIPRPNWMNMSYSCAPKREKTHSEPQRSCPC